VALATMNKLFPNQRHEIINLNICYFRSCNRSWMEITEAAAMVSYLCMLIEALFLRDWCSNVTDVCVLVL
jgi:hypothetical protein